MDQKKKEMLNELDNQKLEKVTGGQNGIIEERAGDPYAACADFVQLRSGEVRCPNCVHYGYHGGLESCEKHQFVF